MDFLFKTFIKDYENVKDQKVRDAYGRLASFVGIISNIFLSAMKILIGLLVSSISIVADGANNLADAGSSIVTLIGFKLASMPEDEDHPYGHARIEYIAGMIVSMLIILVGFELGKSSVEKIINPSPTEFSWLMVIILVIAILVKLGQSLFNVKVGKKINSVTLIATAQDSRNDVISTSVVLLSALVSHFFNIEIDAYMGILVSLFIIYSGISLTKETISPLLGESPDPELVNQIAEETESFPGVIGIHDLVVHDYGPGKVFASIHIEVDSKVDVMKSHELVDNIEFALRKKHNIFLTGHLDPIDLNNENREPITKILAEGIKGMDGVLNFHDLRFVPGDTHTNVIFDILKSPNCKISEKDIHDKLAGLIKEYNEKFCTVINFDISYVKSDLVSRK